MSMGRALNFVGSPLDVSGLIGGQRDETSARHGIELDRPGGHSGVLRGDLGGTSIDTDRLHFTVVVRHALHDALIPLGDDARDQSCRREIIDRREQLGECHLFDNRPLRIGTGPTGNRAEIGVLECGRRLHTDNARHLLGGRCVVEVIADWVIDFVRPRAPPKIDDSPAAAAIESCRYQLYELEKRVVLTLRPAHAKLASAKLYVLITASACARGDWLAATRSALLGRADILQLREKDLEGGELLVRACEFVRLCRDAGAISIINDRVDIAQLAGADGVHLGQGDLPAAEARKLLGHRALIGVSTHQPSQARQAVLDGADYIGAGPVYPSATKPRDISPGLPYLRELSGMSPPFPLPVFAIAGITEARIPEVLSTGMTRIAVTAAATGSADVQAACGRLRHALG